MVAPTGSAAHCHDQCSNLLCMCVSAFVCVCVCGCPGNCTFSALPMAHMWKLHFEAFVHLRLLAKCPTLLVLNALATFVHVLCLHSNPEPEARLFICFAAKRWCHYASIFPPRRRSLPAGAVCLCHVHSSARATATAPAACQSR